ncbi:MAG: tetratricopeptide repeat protein [Sulfuriferula sp.]|nr:tetratricopeptide repeat protein [Sulfuriferula sp.]
MMRGALLAVMLLWASAANAGDLWNRLWHNADQRGEQLMQHGKAADAAKTYADPQRKAYAELQAGDYVHAAQDLAAFDDSRSNYNRGNALAHTGQLQDALKAYDAALARDPKNADARRNRDLVMQALKQQPPHSQHPNNKTASGSNRNGSQNQPGTANQHNGGKEAGKPASPAQQPLPQTGSNGQPNPSSASGHNNGKDGGQTGEQAPSQQTQSQQAQSQSSRPQQSQPAGQQSAAANPAGQSGKPAQSAAAQAQRDTAAGLNKAGQATAPVEATASEQKLAQEQWLRSIPDDPGGLLRRKFLIEHMIRQQERSP